MDKTKTKNTSGGEFIRHSEGSGWAPVPRKAFDDTSLSIEARGCLAWLLTRPDGHRLFVRYAQQRLGISQGRWQRIRRELEASGYLIVQKGRGDGGSYVWNYHIFCSPEAASIGVFTIGRFTTDGSSTGGKPADKEIHPEEREQEKENHAPKVRTTQPIGCATVKAKANNKNNHTPLPLAGEAKAKASPKPKPKDQELHDFVSKLNELVAFRDWLAKQEARDRSAYRLRTHIYPSLFAEWRGDGWGGVVEALKYVSENGYRSFARLNGGEVGEVLP